MIRSVNEDYWKTKWNKDDNNNNKQKTPMIYKFVQNNFDV